MKPRQVPSVTLACALTTAVFLVVTGIATAQTFTVLHSFGSTSQDGTKPLRALIFDSLGNLYGSTSLGGTQGFGTIYRVDPAGNETVVYNFCCHWSPQEIIRYKAHIYGSAIVPGCKDGCGSFFEFSGESSLVRHILAVESGLVPNQGLAVDASGNLYGTTPTGRSGIGCGATGCGTVYSVNNGKMIVLYQFTGAPGGAYPIGGVTLDSAGNIFGTTAGGGKYGAGIAFELSPNGDGTWKEQTIFSYGRVGDGEQGSLQALLIDSRENIYGSSPYGGLGGGKGSYCCGEIYKMRQNSDGSWKKNTLYAFRNIADGAYPTGNLVRDKHANLYGTTQYGGAPQYGTVYKIDPNGVETVLHVFSGETDDGMYPSGVFIDAAGNLYGTTEYGGAGCAEKYGCGTVFKITP